MNRTKRDKSGGEGGMASRPQSEAKNGAVFTAPSTDGRDREYIVVLERKAVYKKPSFL